MLASFPPIVNDQTEILILGTMPGAMSLLKQEYYGHKQNAFWKIMYNVFSTIPVAEKFEEKINMIQRHNIGLWDVLAYCERKGSLDIHIKNAEENDLNGLLENFPKINKILFNGKESSKYFYRKFKEAEGFTYHVMPSTSPANTMKFTDKLASWRQVLLS